MVTNVKAIRIGRGMGIKGLDKGHHIRGHKSDQGIGVPKQFDNVLVRHSCWGQVSLAQRDGGVSGDRSGRTGMRRICLTVGVTGSHRWTSCLTSRAL